MRCRFLHVGSRDQCGVRRLWIRSLHSLRATIRDCRRPRGSRLFANPRVDEGLGQGDVLVPDFEKFCAKVLFVGLCFEPGFVLNRIDVFAAFALCQEMEISVERADYFRGNGMQGAVARFALAFALAFKFSRLGPSPLGGSTGCKGITPGRSASRDSKSTTR